MPADTHEEGHFHWDNPGHRCWMLYQAGCTAMVGYPYQPGAVVRVDLRDPQQGFRWDAPFWVVSMQDNPQFVPTPPDFADLRAALDAVSSLVRAEGYTVDPY